MNTVEAYFTHAGDNGEPYYRTLPNRQLIVHVDGSWHTAVDDNCWQEPIAPISDQYDIKIVEEPQDEPEV